MVFHIERCAMQHWTHMANSEILSGPPERWDLCGPLNVLISIQIGRIYM